MPVVLQFPGLTPPSVGTLGGGSGVNAQIVAGDQQSAVGGQFLPIPLQVLVTDQLGKPLSGQTVTYTVTSGGGSLTSGGIATTDSRGVAAVFWTLGIAVGLQTVSVNPHTGQTLGFSATSTQQISANLSTVSATSPITLSPSAAITTVTVTVLDTFGNPVVGVQPFWNPPGSTILTGMGPTNSAGVSVGTATFVTAADRPIVITVNGVTLLQQPTVVVLGGVSASLSTVSATSPVNVNTLDTVTVTAKDSASHLLSGQPVTLSVSGTGNTVNQPGSPTNSSGVATGSFQSSVAETKTVVAVAGGVTITQQPSVVVNAGSGTVAVVQNFSTYADTAALLADSTLWALSEAKNTSKIALDTTVGYAPLGLTQSMRYDWPNNGAVCLDYSISPGQLKIPGSLTEVWTEYIITFSTNFAVDAGTGSCAKEYKLAAMSDPGGVSRWNLPEMQAGNWVLSSPNGFSPTIVGTFTTSAIWDGNPHVFRCHAKLSSGTGGVMSFWVDGTLVHTETGFGDTGNSQIGWFAPGLNINQGPAVSNMHLWYHRIIVYSTDPGW